MNYNYTITQDELDQIEHFLKVIKSIKENVQSLGKEEKDDIYYGFELGKIHELLGEWDLCITDTLNKISNREESTKDKKIRLYQYILKQSQVPQFLIDFPKILSNEVTKEDIEWAERKIDEIEKQNIKK